MFVLPVFMYLVVPVFVLPVLLLWVFFMRSIEERSRVRWGGRRPPVVLKWSDDRTIVYVTREEDYLRGSEITLSIASTAPIRIPEFLMVFTDRDDMREYRSGTLNDFKFLFEFDEVNLMVSNLIAPTAEYFLTAEHWLKRKQNIQGFTTPKGVRDCFRATYGYAEFGWYGRTVRFFIEKPEAWVPLTIGGTILIGIAMFVLGTWLTMSYIVPLVHQLIG